MSEAKFTKGPWFHDKSSNIGNCISAVTGEWQYGEYRACVALLQSAMPYGKRWTYGEEEENRIANANLIAAAPEMYEMLDMLVDSSNMEDCYHALRENRDEIKALLAKARGEKV